MKQKDFTGKTAVIVCHDAMFGPPHELRDFLLSHDIKKLLFIGHRNRSMHDNAILSSYMELYVHGKKIQKRNALKTSFLPEWLAYIVDSLLTVIWTVLTRGKIDYFIGLGNMNAFCGLFIRAIGKIDKVVYYIIDYIPDRFPSAVMNTLYHRLDYWCSEFSDMTWNYADKMIQARSTRWHKEFPNQYVIPNGIRLRKYMDIRKASLSREIIYIGTLREEQGIQLVIDALPDIIRSVPRVHFSLIGKGEYRVPLERMVAEKHLGNYVTFLGYIEDPILADRRLAKAAVGVATYTPTNGMITFTEPGKVKRYFACGLPVIMTNVGPIAEEATKAGCCIVVPYKAKKLAEAVVSLFRNPKKIEKMREHAIQYVKSFEWDTVFSRAFEKLM